MQTKVTVSLSEELIKEIDEYAKSMHLSRSAGVTVLISSQLQALRSMDTLTAIMEEYKAQQARQAQTNESS